MSRLPMQFLLVALAGWMNQQQRDVTEYLQAENRVLRANSSDRDVCGSPTRSAGDWRRKPKPSDAGSSATSPRL
jgi:hypothetical protein